MRQESLAGIVIDPVPHLHDVVAVGHHAGVPDVRGPAGAGVLSERVWGRGHGVQGARTVVDGEFPQSFPNSLNAASSAVISTSKPRSTGSTIPKPSRGSRSTKPWSVDRARRIASIRDAAGMP